MFWAKTSSISPFTQDYFCIFQALLQLFKYMIWTLLPKSISKYFVFFAVIIDGFSPSLYLVAGYYLYVWNLLNSLDNKASQNTVCWVLSYTYTIPITSWAGNYHHWVHVGKELIELEFQVRAQDWLSSHLFVLVTSISTTQRKAHVAMVSYDLWLCTIWPASQRIWSPRVFFSMHQY